MNVDRARVSHLAFYPVKSGGRIELDEAVLTPAGLLVNNYHDHQFAIVREAFKDGINSIVTQREKGFRELAFIRPAFVNGGIELRWRESDPIELPYDNVSGRDIATSVWGDLVIVKDQGDLLASWISEHVGSPVRLVGFDGTRPARQNYLPNTNRIYAQDAYPVHWFSENSVGELSAVASYDYPWQTFRPQIVVEGVTSRAEHEVYTGFVGGVQFFNAKPCDRCNLIGHDPDSAQLHPNPNVALAKYKSWLSKDGEVKVIFGENMLPQGTGTIRVGDKVDVTALRSPAIKYGAHRDVVAQLKK